MKVATQGGGIFSFIPDAKIVGTNFVNCIANAVTTLSLNAKLHLIPLGGSTFAGDVGGGFSSEKYNGEIVVKLGNLQYGQTRDIFIPMVLSKEANYLAAILEYEGYEEELDHKVSFIATDLNKNLDSVSTYIRNFVVSETLQILNDYGNGKTAKAKKSMDSLANMVEKCDTDAENEDPRLNGLLADLIGFGSKGGRMLKALSTDERFNRWGEHYLRSICRAHQLQLCTNNMDVGLAVYAGNIFKVLQELGGKIFLELPMIKSKLN